MSNFENNPYSYNDTPFESPVPQNAKKDRSTAGLVLGLISIVAWFIPLFGFPITICGIIFSAGSLHSPGRGKAIAGLILSIIFLILTVINSIAGVIMAIQAQSHAF